MNLLHTHPKDIDTDKYRDLLKTGLSHCAQCRGLTVAIVGAGMAGLIAGKLLKSAGFHIRIYEASQRVGGRVKTFRDGLTSGLYAEAGAMRIPKGHSLTRSLCKSLGLTLIRFPEDDDSNTLAYVNGRRITMQDYNKGNKGFDAPYTTGHTTTAILKNALDCLKRRDDKELDRISLGDYLYEFTKPGAKNPVTGKPIPTKHQIDSADLDLIGFESGVSELRASLLEAYRDHKALIGKKLQISNGMDNLPIELVKQDQEIQDSLRYNARVIEIRRIGDKSLDVIYEHPVTHSRYTREDIAFVILAAPFSALTHVRLDNALGPTQLRAIRNLHYDNATKIALEFSDRFWERKRGGSISGGRSFTDLPIRWVHYPAKAQYGKGTSRGVLLASYTWGDDSLRWASLREVDRIRFAARDVAALHGFTSEGDDKWFNSLLVGGVSHSWAQDEYTFGAFSLFDPRQETELFDAIWQPYKRVHFAGEHTSLKHGWIEGALESGIRAALEIYQEVTKSSK